MKLTKILCEELIKQGYDIDWNEIGSIIDIKKLKLKYTCPQKLEIIDWSPVLNICIEYIDCLYENKRFKDGEHYIFETALETIYGKSIWDFMNKKNN